MNATGESFKCGHAREHAAEEKSASAAWHWIAPAILLVCWIAEATMCAERGF